MSHKTTILEIRKYDEQNSQKWLIPLSENVFSSFLNHSEEIAQKVFGEGSLFSPLLFTKFFDPADAFPLWDFDPESLLSKPHKNSSNITVDWSETEEKYMLRAELPVEARSFEVAICGEKESFVEISGIWKDGNNTGRDWKIRKWWECGFVRCLEVGDEANCKKMEAWISNDVNLDIVIPKKV